MCNSHYQNIAQRRPNAMELIPQNDESLYSINLFNHIHCYFLHPKLIGQNVFNMDISGPKQEEMDFDMKDEMEMERIWSEMKADDMDHEHSINCTGNPSSCSCVARTIKLLKEYQGLMADGIEYQMDLINKIRAENHTFLDDYIHITTDHGDIMEILNEELKACNIHYCPFIQQYFNYTTSGNEYVSNQEDEAIFYINLFNSIHCNLMHPSITINPETKHGMTQQKRINDKFNVVINNQNETTMDRLYDYITQSSQSSKSDLYQLQQYFQDEEYDTDIIQYDIQPQSSSNIKQNIHQVVFASLQQYFYISKRM